MNVTASTAGANPTSTAAANAGLPSLADQQRYRAELGLPASAEVVTDLNAQWAAGTLTGAGTTGAVFTQQAQQELDAREDAARQIAGTARAYFGGALADAFGGLYIDHATGDTVVLVTRDQARHLAALRERIAADDRLVVVAARFPLAQLDQIVATLTAKALALESAGAGFVTAGVTENENRVDVALLRDSPAVRQRVLAELAGSDAPAVRFAQGEPVSTTGVDGLNAPPLKGGQRISRTTADPTRIGICTTAFDAYKRTRTDAAIYVTSHFLVTAGHCSETAADMQRPWVQGNLGGATYPIGVPDLNPYVSFGLDAMRLPISAADATNKVAITSTNDRLIYYRQASSADVVTERVCMSGATTGGEICGTLLARNVTVNQGGGHVLSNIRVASFDCKGGDSGGSMLYNSEARGIVQSRGRYPDLTSPFRTFYGHIQPALSALALDNVLGVG